MRALLHIGTEKTGTTSFQHFCHANRAALLDQEVLYPTGLGSANHRHLSNYSLNLGDSDDGMRQLGLSTQEDLDAFREKVRTTLASQIEASPFAKTCILSTEHLHSRLKTVEQVQRLKDLLDPMFDGIDVHLHLRPQIDVAVSLASTQSRVGGAVRREFFDRPKPTQVYYNYNILTDMWENVFGAENVKLLAFRKTPDFLKKTAADIGLDLEGMPVPERVNEAIDVRVMAMVNALTESGTSQRIDHRVLDRLPVNNRLSLSREIAKEVQGRFNASNQTLIKRRSDLVKGDLAPNWSKYPIEGNEILLNEKSHFSEALASLVEHYNSTITSLENSST